ncbi:hypothetical protein [Haliscomenobacter sp.]|uniref:hypothetical protein n=1 Tax=Haliscomenobacter sp. TaxID=2717303 RepID=UPI003BAA22B8
MRIQDSRRHCIKCEHYSRNRTCKAFPEKIPALILSGIQKHNEVLDNQVGTFVYTPLEIYRESELKRMEADEQLVSNYEANKELFASLIWEAVDSYKSISSENFEAIRFIGFMTSGGPISMELCSFPELTENDFDETKFQSGSKIFSVFCALAETERILIGYYQRIDLIVYADGRFLYNKVDPLY